MTLAEILASYDETRFQNEQKAARRRQDILTKYPELAAAEQEILSARNRLAMCVLKGGEDKTACQSELTRLVEKRNDLLKQFGIGQEAFSPIYTCAACKDTGYLDRERLHACECLKKKLQQVKFQDYSLRPEESFEKFDLSVFPQEGEKSQREQMKNYRDQLLKYCARYPDNTKKMLVFLGGTGLGKTFLLKCILRELLKKEASCIYTSAYQMFHAFHRDRLGEGSDAELFFDADCLFVDDLGAEPMTKNVTVEYFFNLLNERQRKNQHTFFASNLTLKQLKERYGEAAFSRLANEQQSAIFVLYGRDIRIPH